MSWTALHVLEAKKKKMHSCYIAPFLIKVNPDNLKINDLLCSCLDELKVTFWKNAVTTCTCIQTLPRDVITFSLFMPEIPEETTMGDTSCPWRYYCKYHTNAVSCIMADTTFILRGPPYPKIHCASVTVGFVLSKNNYWLVDKTISFNNAQFGLLGVGRPPLSKDAAPEFRHDT